MSPDTDSSLPSRRARDGLGWGLAALCTAFAALPLVDGAGMLQLVSSAAVAGLSLFTA